MVTALMEYQSPEDYAKFNGVLLFVGTYGEAVAAGYVPKELYDTDGQIIEVNDEKLDHLKVIVTEENICIQTSGKIQYVSDNVTIADKKMAKAMEAGQSRPAFVLYK